jgi:prepilin-type N-terminal cleavage/methylation domain-containing protein
MKQGFTLIEMTMVLLIIGLLIGSFIIPLGAQMDINNLKLTDQRLAQIKEALLGYAARNRRLPCPDTDTVFPKVRDGKENRKPDNSCDEESNIPGQKFKEGDLPWADLGVDGKDAWGNYFRYRADSKHTTPNAYDISIPASADTLGVKNKAGAVTFVENAVAIVFSNGKNKQSDALNVPSILLDPDSKVYTQGDFVPKDFDDRLVWLSDNELVSRLAAAGFRIK